MLQIFGVSTTAMRTAIAMNGIIKENDINLEEDGPPAEALNYNITSIKRYLSQGAWNKVINSCMYSNKLYIQ